MEPTLMHQSLTVFNYTLNRLLTWNVQKLELPYILHLPEPYLCHLSQALC